MFGEKFENYNDAVKFAENESLKYPKTKFYIVMWELSGFCEIAEEPNCNENIGTDTWVYFENGEEYDH